VILLTSSSSRDSSSDNDYYSLFILNKVGQGVKFFNIIALVFYLDKVAIRNKLCLREQELKHIITEYVLSRNSI